MLKFAAMTDAVSSALAVGMGLAVIFVLVGLAIFLLRGIDTLARRSLTNCYRGLQPQMTPTTEDVVVIYHTYHGFLVWFVETPHQVALPPEQARVLLKRLLWFNLKWGLLSYGAIFIPLLAVGNYWAQQRSILQQVVRKNRLAHPTPLVTEEDAANPYASPGIAADIGEPARRTFVQWGIGLVSAGMCFLFGLSAVVNIFRLDLPGVIGGIFLSSLLGLFAWSYLFKPPEP